MHLLWCAHKSPYRIASIIHHLKTFKTTTMESTDKTLRLTSFVRPEHYDLILRPDLDRGKFNGTVRIDVNVKKAINCMKLNTKFLNISEVNVNKEGQPLPVTNISENKELEQLQIYFQHELHPGDYQISINFDGSLNNGIVGLYLSHLTNKRAMVASKFQPTYARQAFPCFDEPDFKATYDITLVKPRTHIALSNMNEVSVTPDEDITKERVTFARSVPMSTYLAVFVICDFDSKTTDINTHGIGHTFQLRSFAQKDETHKIDFAQDIGKRATEFYIKYYEVPFPLPKLDMIAIPDYVSGATEHWGLITYRETSFLIDEATASVKNKINVANTIAHELAHMWFGNLVTMKWWDEVWLNEGFASYMQVKSLNAIEPSWSMLDTFLVKTLHPVLVTDAKLSSHPIVQIVDTPDQITAIFDAISYNKGASVLRMLEGFIGEEYFRRGVSDYLKQHKFENTITPQLLSNLEPYFKIDNPNLNLSYIMDTWTKQMGYPVLNVKKGVKPHTYDITQARFLLDPRAVSPDDSPFNYRWFVPITYKTNNGVNKNTLWFSDKADTLSITINEEVSWLKINNDQVGYYRVNYTPELWQELIVQLKSKSNKLTISDRSHLLDDAFALAEANAFPYDLALDITTYLKGELDYVPWQTASGIFKGLSQRLLNSLAYTHLQNHVQRLVEPVFKSQRWDAAGDLSVTDRLFRACILSVAAHCGLPDANTKIKNLFNSWLQSQGTALPALVEPDLRDIVYLYGMKSTNQAAWDSLWEIYLKETDVQEQTKIRAALAAPQDADILKKYLALASEESNIRSQDYLSVLAEVSANPVGASLVWDEVRARWPELVDRFTLNSRYLGNLIPAITSGFNTEAKLKEMQEFFDAYKEAGAGARARRRALENVRNNISWTAQYYRAVARWLAARDEEGREDTGTSASPIKPAK